MQWTPNDRSDLGFARQCWALDFPRPYRSWLGDRSRQHLLGEPRGPFWTPPGWMTYMRGQQYEAIGFKTARPSTRPYGTRFISGF